MKSRFCVVVAAMVIAMATTARAQATSPADSSAMNPASDSAVAAHGPVASSIDAPPAAVHRATAPRSLDAAMAATRKNLGQARAMMIVGGVGFVAGALMGGDAGTIVMLGSAVVGLYGLYQYLQ
jgi:hypothetical protein